tara:strand:+ start:11374 stop:12399 length:1026 start_codon:yes stop_codon:yes gene_type:complete
MKSKSIQDQITFQEIIIDKNLKYFKPGVTSKQKTLQDEIALSLTNTPKSISPKFFYDDLGSKLFDEICSLPEYYLYNSEIEILQNFDRKIKPFIKSEMRLVELGSGSSVKTRLLLDMLFKFQTNVEYFPIDISDILSESTKKLCKLYKNLKVIGMIDTYESGLDFIEHYDDKANLISFLGSSFGNFNQSDGTKFLKMISDIMKKTDLFLIGVDLKKDSQTLYNAYNDSKGITAEFNLNILDRMNRDLDANFQKSMFSHYAIYNEKYNRIEMYIKSLCSQTVNIPKAGISISLAKNELIHTENSYKFSLSQIESKFESVGLKINQVWHDSKNYFVLVLGQKI